MLLNRTRNRELVTVPRLGGGYAWPSTGTEELSTIGDVFGMRPFSFHPSGEDMHRGVDTLNGQPPSNVYSPIDGLVTRKNYTHVDGESDQQINRFTTYTDLGGDFSFINSPSSGFDVALNAVGSAAIYIDEAFAMADAGAFAYDLISTAFGDLKADQHVYLGIASVASIQDMIDNGPENVAGLQYGVAGYEHYLYSFNLTGRAWRRSEPANTGSGAIAGAPTKYDRIIYEVSEGYTFELWGTNVDPGTSTLALIHDQGLSGFTIENRQNMRAFLMFYNGNVSENLEFNFSSLGYYDTKGIGRFGNWLQVANDAEKFAMMHFSDISVNQGDFVRAGQVLGTTGVTGFDRKSGRILTSNRHIHCEYIDNNEFFYDNEDPKNWIGLVPRPEGTVQITMTVTDGNDPYDATPSHVMEVTLYRESVEGDDIEPWLLNEFTLTGNTTSRTVNWNTRVGLDPTDNDANTYDGVAVESVAFDTTSDFYRIRYYFEKAVVGSAFVSAAVKDTYGNTLASL